MNIAVITPSLPTRAYLLCRAIESVNQQTLPPDEHLICVDYSHIGPARIRNQLISSTVCDWIAFLDDDDRFDPHHLHTLAERADEADVIIPYCRFDGPPLPAKYHNRPYDRRVMRSHGIFPITVLARKETMEEAGLFHPADRYEDWSMFNRMADQGARFLVLPTQTWTYTTSHSDRRTRTG